MTDSTQKAGIDTRIVYGFLDAGKTTYIQDCIRNDFFHKYGKTLILCFEQGEESYDTALLREKNAQLACFEGGEDPAAFCDSSIALYQPDRIYVEMNCMIPDLREKLSGRMRVTSAVTWIDWATLNTYFVNFRQMISQMVADSLQVTFRGCPAKELLAPYSEAFRLMNRRASYLREDPMGYHEKAFDLFLPYSLEEAAIEITRDRYLPFWLDAAEHPEHYEGKFLQFSDPLELRKDAENGSFRAGRVVMTCCMSDLQFMSFALEGSPSVPDSGGWFTFEACGFIGTNEHRQRILKLKGENYKAAQPPKDLILKP